MTAVTDAIGRLRARIAAAAEAAKRDPDGVHLVAVSKRHSAALVRDALDAGQRDFGENFVTEAVAKIAAVNAPEAVWHFIGQLQGNKTRPVAAHFDWVHTVDRARIARRLSAQRPTGRAPLNVCLQLRLTDEAHRGGAAPGELADLAALVESLPGLRLRGLMGMPPTGLDDAALRAAFRTVAAARDALARPDRPLDVLSMGMSGDLEEAIAEGATHVRIGTAIFGQRPPAAL